MSGVEERAFERCRHGGEEASNKGSLYVHYPAYHCTPATHCFAVDFIGALKLCYYFLYETS